MDKNLEWMEEVISDVPTNKKVFNFIKFILGRRKKGLTYKELYIMYTHIYDFKRVELSEVKKKAMETILEIYHYNNEKYPE